MAADAQDRGWGGPCKGRMVTLVRADGLRIPVRAELLDLTAMLFDLVELGGYDIKPGQTWGYACRKISGTNTWSNHSWGLADDINAPANPYASAEWHRRNARGTFPFGLQIVCDIPEKALRLFEDYGYRLGAKYTTKPDPMHVEFMGTPAEAVRQTARLKKWIADNGATPPAPIPLPEEETVMRVIKGDQADDVFISDGKDKRYVGSMAFADYGAHHKFWPDGRPLELNQGFVDDIPILATDKWVSKIAGDLVKAGGADRDAVIAAVVAANTTGGFTEAQIDKVVAELKASLDEIADLDEGELKAIADAVAKQTILEIAS